MRFSPQGSSPLRRRMRWQAFLPEVLVLGTAAVILFAGLGQDELRSADEATHAQVSREMVQNGHWLWPTCRGEPYFEKPPLKFWLTAATFLVAGESEFNARLWSALFGLATVWATMRLGARLFNRRAGLAAGLVLATTWEFLHNHCCRTGELDSALLFFATMLVGSAWRARVEGTPRHLWLAALWMALGFLTKGHVILIPLAWLPFVAWIRPPNNPRPNFRWHWAGAISLFFAVAAPWFILQQLHYGGKWFGYMLHHNLAGYVRGTVETADAGIGYYVEELVWLDYPWPPLAILGALMAFWHRGMVDLPLARIARLWTLAWISATAIVLACSRTSLPWYHLPALVPMALLAGLALERWWDSPTITRCRAWDGLWLALHLALFFAMPGFLECAQDWLQTWVSGDADAFDGLCEYFLRDPHQRSMGVALLVLPLFLLLPVLGAAFRRRGHAHPELLASRIRVALLAGLAIPLMFQAPPDDTEGAQDEAREILARIAPASGITPIHLFEVPRSHAPHWGVSPALFYYMSGSSRIEWQHHPADPAAWKRFCETLDHPCVAIIPTEWLGAPDTHPARVVSVMEIKPCSVVRVVPVLGVPERN